MADFRAWLQEQMELQKLNTNKLAERAGLDPGYLGRVLNGSRNPGLDTYQAIAQGLKKSTDEVLKAAGVIRGSDLTPRQEELLGLFDQLNEQDQNETINFVRFKSNLPLSAEWLLYSIMDQASKDALGMIFTNFELHDLQARFNPDRYRIIEHGYVRGQGHVYEVIDLDEGRVGVSEDDE